ncbi:MAG: AAA family ATPase [Proteobacteria bacterium]|nr:AAA family ATPase [Pseudomonadota bacterium]
MRKLLFVVLMSSSAISSSVPCYGGKDSKPPLDVTENLNFRHLCTQSEILKRFPRTLEREGLSALIEDKNSNNLPRRMEMSPHPLSKYEDTKENLNQALVDEFLKRKQSAMTWALAQGCTPYGCDLLTVAGTIFTAGCGSIASGFGIFKAAGTMKEAFQQGIKQGSKITTMDTDVRLEYEKKYVQKKRFLPESLQKAIENKLSATYQCDESNLEPTLKIISQILNFPTRSKPLARDFQEKVEELGKGYTMKPESTTLSKELLSVCMSHCVNYSEAAGENNKSREMVCLQGPPGIGKSYISQALGRALGVRTIRVLLQDPKSFFGDSNNPGSLLLALCEEEDTPRNAVLVIDEVDQSLNEGQGVKSTDSESTSVKVKVKSSPSSATSSWLDFFDPDKKKIFFPYLGTWLDISHFLIVTTCNGDISQQALKDRIPTFNLTGLTSDRKKEIVKKNIFPLLLKSESPDMNLTEEEVEYNQIERIIDEENLQSLRPIERKIKDYLNVLRVKKLKSSSLELNMQPEPKEKDVKPKDKKTQ